MKNRERIEWHDAWVTGANDDTLPRALLVGDSIAQSYFGTVETELKGRFLCARMTTSMCVCDPVVEKELDLLLDEYRFAVIHFNNGLHGWDYDETAYGEGLARTLDFILSRCPQTRLIWAATTPVRRTDDLNRLDPRTDRVLVRNQIARDLAAERRLPVNDLFGCVVDHPEYFSQDGVHLNPDGRSVLGKQVADSILSTDSRAASRKRLDNPDLHVARHAGGARPQAEP